MGLEHYALHLLTFIFGYVTCRTFYFIKSARISVILLKIMHVVSLSILIKCIEEYSFVSTEKLKTLSNCGVMPSDEVYKKIEIENENTITLFKERSIATMISLHPEYFRNIIEFEDWNTAMLFLQRNKEIGKAFLS
jgi:hypothetical protein